MRSRRGISVLIEAVVVSVMVVTAFAVAYYYSTPGNPRLQRSQVDLNQLDFNILNALAQGGAFTNTIVDSSGNVVPGWERSLNVALLSLVPSGYVYNLTVYNMSVPLNAPYNVTPVLLNKVPITNANSVAFSSAAQVSEVSYVYTATTSPTLTVLLLQLQLARVTSP
jgi:hypothetical protein